MLTSTLSKEAPFVGIQDGITLANAIVDTVRDPLVVLDHDLRVIAASRSFYKTFRLVREDVRGHLLYEIDGDQWDIPELRDLLETISNGQATIEGYEVDREFPAIGRRVMLLNARKVFYEKGAHTTVLLAFEDITDRRAIELQVQELLREKDMLLEEMQHRVANSLQIIASILLIKARTVQSEETRLQLEDAHQRVLSVAAVQQHLHVVGGGKPIEVGNYLTKLCETLAQSMIGDSRTNFAQSRCRCWYSNIARCRQHRADRDRTGDERFEARFSRCEAGGGDRRLLQSRRNRLEADRFR